MKKTGFSSFPRSALQNCDNWANAKNKVVFSTKPTGGDLISRRWRVEEKTEHLACGIKVVCETRGKFDMKTKKYTRYNPRCRVFNN